MVWFQIDDKFWLHPKALRAGNEAIGLWARAGSHSMSYLTNGVVDDATVMLLAMPSDGRELAQKLVDAELWHRTDGGYMFHDWEHNQRTAEQVKRDKEGARDRQRRRRERLAGDEESTRHAVTDAVTHAVSNTVSHATHTQPSQAIDNPSSGDELAQKRAARKGEIDDAFEQWWAVYPRKQGKTDARKAFGQLMSKGQLPELDVLVARTKRYAQQQEDPQFTKLPAGWLRSGRYDDETLDTPAAKTSEGTSQLGVWLTARGSSLEEYERRKSEPGWLEGLKGNG